MDLVDDLAARRGWSRSQWMAMAIERVAQSENGKLTKTVTADPKR